MCKREHIPAWLWSKLVPTTSGWPSEWLVRHVFRLWPYPWHLLHLLLLREGPLPVPWPTNYSASMTNGHFLIVCPFLWHFEQLSLVILTLDSLVIPLLLFQDSSNPLFLAFFSLLGSLNFLGSRIGILPESLQALGPGNRAIGNLASLGNPKTTRL